MHLTHKYIKYSSRIAYCALKSSSFEIIPTTKTSYSQFKLQFIEAAFQ